MALTRAFLKSMQLTDEQVTAIIEAHSDTVNGLKKEINDTKLELENVKNSKTDDKYKTKYEKEHEDFEKYKQAQADKESLEKKQKSYAELLRKAGIKETAVGQIVKLTDMSNVEFDEKGNIKDSDKLTDGIKSDWSEFVVKTETKGATVDNPPSTNGNVKTREDILKITDRDERRKAIAENPDLFK